MFGNLLQNTSLGGDYDLNSTNAVFNEEETVPLVTKKVSHRQCCHPDMNTRWLKPSLVITFPRSATRMQLLTTVVVAAVLCFTACVVLFHPHRVGVLAAPVKRLD